DQGSGLYSILYDVIGEKGDAGALFYQGADQFCAPDFQNRLNFQGQLRQFFFQQTAVAHAFFCQDERLTDQFLDRKGGSRGKAGAGSGYEISMYSFLTDNPVFCIVNVIIQSQDSIYLIVVHKPEHFFCSGCNDFQRNVRIKTAKMLKTSGQKRGTQRVSG